MKCPNCHNEVKDTDSYCSNCGSKIIPDIPNNVNEKSSEKTLKDIGQIEKKSNKKIFIILTVGLLILLALVFFFVFNNASDESSTKGTNDDIALEEKNGDNTKKPIYVELMDEDDFDYNIPDEALSFINEHSDFFPGNENNTGARSDFTNYEIGFPQIAKNPSKYSGEMVFVNGEVVDCKELETEDGMVTFIQVVDVSGYSFCGYYLGVMDELVQGVSVSLNILPFDVITFENMGGAYTEAVIGAISYPTVYTYTSPGYGQEPDFDI